MSSRTDPGAMLSAAHELADGRSARLRLTRPTDAGLIRAFLETLGEVPDSVVHQFTYYEPREQLMIAASSLDQGTEKIVGLASVAMLETGTAEIAVVVDDDRRGIGVGTLLTEAVASLALRRGATHMKATMDGDNDAMLRLMERQGQTVCAHEDGTIVAYTRLEPRLSGRSAA
jgi:GNAT superfamily N-acetyltransferase